MHDLEVYYNTKQQFVLNLTYLIIFKMFDNKQTGLRKKDNIFLLDKTNLLTQEKYFTEFRKLL